MRYEFQDVRRVAGRFARIFWLMNCYDRDLQASFNHLVAS